MVSTSVRKESLSNKNRFRLFLLVMIMLFLDIFLKFLYCQILDIYYLCLIKLN